MLTGHGICLQIGLDPIHGLLGHSWTTDDSDEDLKIIDQLVSFSRESTLQSHVS